MLNSYINIFNKEKNKIDLILLLLISFLPLFLLLPSAILNSIIILTCFIFIIKIVKKKKYYLLNDSFFFILILFWCSLIINLFFSINLNESYPRGLGFLRFIILAFAIKYYLNFKDNKYQEFIYKNWFWIFIIVTFDLIFEYIFGFNTLGFRSPWDERLSGFLNQELKIGNYFFLFSFFALSYLFYNLKITKLKIFLFLLIFLIFLLVSFIIGERSNFIRMLFISFFFLIQFDRGNIYKKIFLAFFSFTLFIIIIFYVPKFKVRYLDQIFEPIKSNGIFTYIENTHYGAHFDTAINIFKQKPIFGVGLKNFRNEASKEIYQNELLFNSLRWSTHPHQIHLEFLSESGIFGYTIFLIFIIYSLVTSIKIYLGEKNLYHLSSILFFIASVLPIIPSGSFFTSYSATIFWINYGVMISYKKGIKKS